MTAKIRWTRAAACSFASATVSRLEWTLASAGKKASVRNAKEASEVNMLFDNSEITPLSAIAFPLTRTNAVAYFCCWKLSDALLNRTLRNTEWHVAFGDTRKQRFMGAWGDGRPVREPRTRRPQASRKRQGGVRTVEARTA